MISRIPSGSRLTPVARHINSLTLTQSSQGVQPSELLHLEQVVAVNPGRGLRVGCGLHRRRKGRPLGRGGGGEQKEATDLSAIRLPARGHGGSGYFDKAVEQYSIMQGAAAQLRDIRYRRRIASEKYRAIPLQYHRPDPSHLTSHTWGIIISDKGGGGRGGRD